MTTFAITTLGCKVNAFESESYVQSLTMNHFQQVDFKESADIYLINTCSVTNNATAKSRQKIAQAQRSNPEALIVVVGCYVQTHHEELKQQLGIDVLIGAAGKSQLIELIDRALKNREKQFETELTEVGKFENLTVENFNHQTRAFLKIQDGCNQYCSYCIIPYARGRERSRSIEQVIQSADMLSRKHLEIVLAGIHTGRYGKEEGHDLTELLRRLSNEVPTLKRIRISSIEITEVTDELIELIASDKKIAIHLHIPLQSGCDATLARMNRPYTVEEYLERLRDIRRQVPDISISTDLIVGFPNESDEEFETTLTTLQQAEFSFIHVFPYSKREYTVAATFEDHVSPLIKKQRVRKVSQLSLELYEKYMNRFIGKEISVIIEKQTAEGYFGHSSEYMPVFIESEAVLHTRTMVNGIGSAVKNGSITARKEG